MSQRLVIDIPIEEGEPLGATPNDKLMVTRIQPGTVAEGKLKPGDTIVLLNDRQVRDPDHFFRLLRTAHPTARLLITRDAGKRAELEQHTGIPADRERVLQRRSGFTYHLMRLEWKQGGPKLGLGIKHYQNRVLVSRTEDGSLSAAVLRIGDHLVDVDGVVVSDKDVAKQLLLTALQNSGVSTCVVERPESAEAESWTNNALAASPMMPPSVAMASDVASIVKRQKEKMREGDDKLVPILIRNRSPSPAANKPSIAFTDGHQEMVIASDNEGKELRPVKK
jgi:hypothetical protein